MNFVDYSPLIKGAFLGIAKCIVWAKLGGAWDTEIACYENGVIKPLIALPTGVPVDSTYKLSDKSGNMRIVVNSDGSYRMEINPTVGTGLVKTGQF